MDASGGTLYMQESSSNNSSRKQAISNEKGTMKHGYLLYICINKFPASQDIPISMRCLRHQRVDAKRFPTRISGNPGST